MAEITIVLRGDAADRLQRLLDEKRYAAPEDAVADALDALAFDEDPEIDAWLREVVVPRAKELEDDPTKAISASELRKRLFGKD